VTPADTVRLEGFHALKHALRFGADVVSASGDREELERLAAALAPDVDFGVVEHAPGAPLVAEARRPGMQVLGPGPVVLLENPRHLGNLGACIRVAAAAGAGGVLVTGTSDPWHPDAIRGAAGLQFALPVLRADAVGDLGRTLVAVDPDGDDVTPPEDAMFAFGSERHGLSDDLLARADMRLRIPMRPGVSSLNLATSVAAVLYSLRPWPWTP
jgi:TrmH family RNA methyltransferase